MKCPLCSNDVQIEHTYKIYKPSITNSTDISELNVCFTCYMLTSILQTLKEIKDGKP